MKKSAGIFIMIGIVAIVFIVVILYNPTNQNQSAQVQTPAVLPSQNVGAPAATPSSTSAPSSTIANTDCGSVNATELKAGAITQNAEQFLACVNSSLETCHAATAAMSVNGNTISFATEQLNGGCALKFILPQSEGNFNLVCPFPNEAMQSFFSAVENATSIAPTAAMRDSLKGLTFINTILGLAGAQMVKIAPTSTTANFSFSLPHTDATINCLVTSPSAQATVFHASAENKTTGITYSNLTLSIPQDAFTTTTDVTVGSLAATEYDRFLGGFYMLHPSGAELLVPATVSITYNDAAVALYRKRFPNFVESNLTLAYYDNTLNKYIQLPSTFDPATRTVTGNISRLYGGGIMIFPTSFFTP